MVRLMSMRQSEVRLGVDCGSVTTAAVLAWDGGWLPLRWDGWPWLSSAVHVASGGQIATGQQAWQYAASTPDGFELSPLRRAGTDRIVLAGVEVPVVDLVAATLRRVADEAVRVVGGPVDDVRLVVPAGWGPRRLTWLRQAARRAGLPEAALVPAPVAIAQHLAGSGVRLAVGSTLAVCDLGGGAEVSVLHRSGTGFEILSTLDDLRAGGVQIDEMVVAQLNGHGQQSGGAAWDVVGAARMAKEAVSVHPSVTVGTPPTVLTAGQIGTLARPVLERAASLTVEAIAAAELTADRLAGVFVAGGGANMPLAGQVIAEAVGREPTLVVDAGAAAVRGAAQAAGPATGIEAAPVEAGPPIPPARRVAALAVPGIASIALLVAFLAVKERAEGPYDAYDVYERGPWGGGFTEFIHWALIAMAATLILVACLSGAALLASVLPMSADPVRPAGSDAAQMGGGLLVAAVVGTAIAALYAVGTAVYFEAPIDPFLRWTVLPVAPIALAAVAVAVVTSRWGRRPATGWHGWLHFPISSTLLAAAGMLLIEYVTAYVPYGLQEQISIRVGGLLIGVGAALALVSGRRLRLLLAAPFGVVMAGIAEISTTGILAVIYVIAVTVWWLQRLWQLWQRPPQRWLPST